MKRTAWFPFGGKVASLPRKNLRVYFDPFSSEASEVSETDRLLEIGYAVKNGCNLKSTLKSFIKNGAPTITEDIVKQSLVNKICYMRSGDSYDMVNEHLLSLISFQEAIDLFLEELSFRYVWHDDGYDDVVHELYYFPWDYNMIASSEHITQEKFNYIVCHATPTMHTPSGIMPITKEGWEVYIQDV